MSSTTAVALSGIGQFTQVKVGLKFGDLGYIGKPYHMELDFCIDLTKGVSPMLKPEKRQQVLDQKLEKLGVSQKEYQRKIQRSKRPFYTITDSDDGSGEIIIPRHVILGMLGHCMKVCPLKEYRLDMGLLHNALQIKDGHFLTGKTVADAQVFGRFVKMDASNQRSREDSLYIPNFTATGVLMIDEPYLQDAGIAKPAETLAKVLQYCGKYIGIGSSRTQGYGRFRVEYFDLLSE